MLRKVGLVPVELRLTLRNDMESLAHGNDRIDDFLRANHVDDTSIGQVMVIIDELASNVVRYAWPRTTRHSFDLTLSLQPDGAGLMAVLTLEDDGRPFDPTAPRTLDTHSSLEDMEIGGIGLVIVARTSNRFEYRREGGRNCLVVGKRVAVSP